MGRQLLRISHVATFLGVSQQRVSFLYRHGRLPKPAKVDAIGPLWDRDTIESWAEREWWGKSRTPWRQRPYVGGSA